MMNFAGSGSGANTRGWQTVSPVSIIATPATPRQPRNGGMGPFVAGMIGSLLLLIAASTLHAQVHAIKRAIEPKPNVAETSLDSYLERVRAANSNVQPVAGSIWTADGARGLRVARGLQTGNISINSHLSVRVSTPFGGMKTSGLGRELGPDAVHDFTETKTIFVSTAASQHE